MSDRPERIGVLGGAFNPPHRAHLALARAAADGLDLDRVLLVPASRPPHRALEADPGPEVRLALCRAAVADAGDPRLQVSDLEVARGGTSYTATTLAELAGCRPGAELVLVLGADAAASLPTWHEPETVLAHALVGVGERPGTPVADVRAALEGLGAADRLRTFPLPASDVSSTAVRDALAGGAAAEDLLGPRVRALVVGRGLYATGRPSTVGRVVAPTAPADPATPAAEAEPASEVPSPGATVGPAGRGPRDDAALAALVADVAAMAADRKAADLEAVDLREVSPFTDAFLLCTGGTERQVKAIHDAVLEGMRTRHGRRPRSVEGLPEARWVLLDYGDVVVHVQVPEARDHYRLGRLWGDRPRIPLPAPAAS